MHDASELARMLARNVVRLVRDLLPNGHREGAEWMHASLAGASRRSLSVRLSGMKQGVWADFSSGDAGDSLDLVASVQYLGDKRKAIAWARSWMGVADATTPTAERRMPAAPPGILLNPPCSRISSGSIWMRKGRQTWARRSPCCRWN